MAGIAQDVDLRRAASIIDEHRDDDHGIVDLVRLLGPWTRPAPAARERRRA
jgi:hypothetical protein